MRVIDSWHEFEAQLAIQWDYDLHNHLCGVMGENNEGPEEVLSIEVKDEMDWVTEHNDRQEHEVYRSIYTNWHVYTAKYVYTFKVNGSGEGFAVSSLRNNTLPYPVFKSTKTNWDGYSIHDRSEQYRKDESIMSEKMSELDAVMLKLPQNSNYEPYTGDDDD